jgi:hypothetical protein
MITPNRQVLPRIGVSILMSSILFALTGVAHAGGDFVLGKVSAFAGEDGNYRFHFS